ncbi:hypothetical protein CKO14_01375 [Halorhodospira halophila]|nr:hypothetical protein [Halorhodospira halophila]
MLAATAGASNASEPDQVEYRTGLDVLEFFLSASQPMDNERAQALFGAAVASNMRVPPEHLGVAFHDRRTGGALDPQEVRELIGPVRQDGARQLIHSVSALFAGYMPMAPDQLELLLDAAFVASLRRPPPHIDVEFYDRRHGPTGLGGGVSGRVPDDGAGATEPGPGGGPGVGGGLVPGLR